MADIFISYARDDVEFITPLKDALEAYGWRVCWDRDVPPGENFREAIEELIGNAKCLIVAWSFQSVCSQWVVINSFGENEKSCRFSRLVRDQCDDPQRLVTSERYNRFDVIPIFVMCDDALVELDAWYGKSVARQENSDLHEQELEIWIDHVLMLTSIVVNRLAVSLRHSEYAERYVLQICQVLLNELSLKMNYPPSGKSLFRQAARASHGSPDDVLYLLRESDVRLSISESE